MGTGGWGGLVWGAYSQGQIFLSRVCVWCYRCFGKRDTIRVQFCFHISFCNLFILLNNSNMSTHVLGTELLATVSFQHLCLQPQPVDFLIPFPRSSSLIQPSPPHLLKVASGVLQ